MTTPRHPADGHHGAAERHEHDLGLAHDLSVLNRRRALTLLGGAGLAALVGCGSSSSSSGSSSTTTSTSAASGATASTAAGGAATCDVATPEETAGPFPGDGSNGSNGPDVLTQSGVVRRDIRSSFGSMSGTAEGVPLDLVMTLSDSSSDCGPLAGAAVYVWHCDRDGEYSLYGRGVTDQNYLRGVQVADDAGRVDFTSIFPGCYSGRWPHIHFEVYSGVDEATGGGTPRLTSQIALTPEACAAAYQADGYGQAASNLTRTSLSSDMVFRDGWDQELATMSGSASQGYSCELAVTV